MAKNWYTILNRKAQAWGIPNEVETELEQLAEDALSEAMSSERTAVITARCMEGWVFGGYLQETDPNMEIDEYRISNPEFYKIAFSKEVSDFDRRMIIFIVN
jgi:hypothetical protein